MGRYDCMALNDLERATLSHLELQVARWRVARWCLLVVGALLTVPFWLLRPSDLEPIFTTANPMGVHLYAIYNAAVLTAISFCLCAAGIVLILFVVLRWRGSPLHILLATLVRKSLGVPAAKVIDRS